MRGLESGAAEALTALTCPRRKPQPASKHRTLPPSISLLLAPRLDGRLDNRRQFDLVVGG